MRKMLLIATLVGATLFVPGLTPEAQASHRWSAIGGAFQIGAAHISFVFGHSPYGYGPAYYYRYDRPIRYRGHDCSRHCFHDAGYYYHHDSCPLVVAHFGHYRVDPYWAFDRYAPRVGGYGGSYGNYDRHDRHDRYDRNDRYDRHDRDRYDRHDRYDRRDRYDRYDRRGRYDRNDRYDDDRHDRRHDRRRRGHHRHYKGCGH